MRWLSRSKRRLALAVLAVASLGVAGGGAVVVGRSGIVGIVAARAGNALARAAQDSGFVVDNVAVVGRERTSRKAILEALEVERGAPILAVDLEAAKARLERLTWVRRADIERRLPDTIFVRLVERQPLAFWQRNGKLALIDTDGAVVPTDRLDGYGALIVVVGEDAPKLAGPLLEMLASEPALRAHVAAAVRVGGRRWNLRLDNGIDVALPEEDPASAWHRLASLDRSDRVLERAIEEVDLRLPDRLVLRLPPEPAKQAPHKKPKLGGKPT